MNTIPAYKVEPIGIGTTKIQYLFESHGHESIVKVVEYSFLRKLSGKKIYNLGFGDYDEESETVLDDISSNNGDMRKVFRTVLNTVPHFFAKHKESAIWIQGSDSKEDFRAKCEPDCTKRCDDICKNYNRRIKAYKYYIEKNFIELSKEYIIFGFDDPSAPYFVQYTTGNKYLGILVFRKK